MNLTPTEKTLFERIEKLNVNKSGGIRSPHKPLLLLIAIGKLLNGQRVIPFKEVEEILAPLLLLYAPPIKSRPQPELPYWFLQSDLLWVIEGKDDLPKQASGFPKKSALKESSGGLEVSFASALLNNKAFSDVVVMSLLEEYFPESLHEDILSAVGLTDPRSEFIMEAQADYGLVRRRDPKFRDRILQAYEYRCAATGFRAALGGAYFGCEAAHIQWHAYDGPDSIENGIALEPTLHKLFDAGAWSLTDDRRIIVSMDFTGNNETVSRIRQLHGKPLFDPLPGQPKIAVEYIRWHREEAEGGVFRTPALPL